MAMLLSHTTALEALRDLRLCCRLAMGDRCSTICPGERPTRAEVESLLERYPTLTSPVHVLVASTVNRRPRANLRVHTSKDPLPAGSAIELTPGVLCDSPEPLLGQRAPRLTQLEASPSRAAWPGSRCGPGPLRARAGLRALELALRDAPLHALRPQTRPGRLAPACPLHE